MSDDLRTMFDSDYLGAWNVAGKDYNVTIERIEGATITGDGGKKNKKPLIYFKGVKKPLICNKTIMKTLFAMFGTHSAKAMLGKRITLYATTCRGAAGGTVDCVRVRPDPPKAGQDQAPNESAPMDPDMRRNQQEQAQGERKPGEEG